MVLGATPATVGAYCPHITWAPRVSPSLGLNQTSRSSFFFLIIGRPPRPPLFPYTTLFRSKISRMCWDGGRLWFTASGGPGGAPEAVNRSEEHTAEPQSPCNLVCRPLLC